MLQIKGEKPITNQIKAKYLALGKYGDDLVIAKQAWAIFL